MKLTTTPPLSQVVFLTTANKPIGTLAAVEVRHDGKFAFSAVALIRHNSCHYRDRRLAEVSFTANRKPALLTRGLVAPAKFAP